MKSRKAKISTPSRPASTLDLWLTPARFSALLLVLIGVQFPEVVTGQRTFFYRDFGGFGYPLAFFHRESFWRGEIPLWNPLSHCGLPFLAQWNTMTLYPLSLVYLLIPLSWSLGVFCLIHVFLAGLGMYFLAHRWTANRLAASVAGIGFAISGVTWHSTMWPNNISAIAWMPWVVLTAEAACRRGGRRIPSAAVIGAMQMLTGAPEVIFLTWGIVVLFGLLLFVQREIRRRLGARFFLSLGLVAGIAAVQLVPFVDLLLHSQRDAVFNLRTVEWAMPLSGLANFLVPLFHGYKSGHGVVVQYGQYWVTSYYLGTTLVALALLAIWRVYDRRVWLLLAITLLGVGLAMGTEGRLYSTLTAILPPIGFMRYPIKFVLLTVFALPLLAAFAIRWLQNLPTDAASAVGSLRVIGLILLVLIALIVLEAWKSPMLRPPVREDWNSTLHNGLTRAAFLTAALGILILLHRPRPHRFQTGLGISFLLLLWLDVYTHEPSPSPTVERVVYEPGLMRRSLNLDPQPQWDDPRAMSSAAAVNQVNQTSLTRPSDDYLLGRFVLFDNCNLLDGIPKADGFFSLELKEYERVSSLLSALDARGADLQGLKDFLGIARICQLAPASTNGLKWTERNSILPRVSAGQQPAFADGTNVLRALFADPDFDARRTVYLPVAAQRFITAKAPTQARVFPVSVGPQKLVFEVEVEAPAMVVVAQAFHHPWDAHVDDRPATLWKANYAFQALEVPPGRHRVSLTYQDRFFQWGVVLSTISLLACVLLRHLPKTLPFRQGRPHTLPRLPDDVQRRKWRS